jgi:hypothetical protein
VGAGRGRRRGDGGCARDASDGPVRPRRDSDDRRALRGRGAQRPPGSIVIVAIDQNSLARLPRFPFRWSIYARDRDAAEPTRFSTTVRRASSRSPKDYCPDFAAAMSSSTARSARAAARSCGANNSARNRPAGFVDGAVRLSRAPISRSLGEMAADGLFLNRDGRSAKAHLSDVPEIGEADRVRARVPFHELDDLTTCAQREALAMDTTGSASRGASRGAKNSGNQRQLTTGPGSSHPSGVAQWRPVTINGNRRRATYKQEVRGSSPRPPTLGKQGFPTGRVRRDCRKATRRVRLRPTGPAGRGRVGGSRLLIGRDAMSERDREALFLSGLSRK